MGDPARTHRLDPATRRTPRQTRRPKRRATPLPRQLPLRSRRPEIQRRKVLGERLGEIGTPKREVDDSLEEPQLVAGVVPDAFDFAGVNRPALQQLAQSIRQLNLARA